MIEKVKTYEMTATAIGNNLSVRSVSNSWSFEITCSQSKDVLISEADGTFQVGLH